MGYLPCDFMKHGDEILSKLDNNLDTYEQYKSTLPDTVSKDQFIDYILSNDFLKNTKPAFKQFDDELIKQTPAFLTFTGIKPKDIYDKNISLSTEWRDALIADHLFKRWAKAKQVYKPDKDFVKALMATEHLKFQKSIFEHLPVNEFYLDLSNMEFKDIHGCFVFVKNTELHTYITLYALSYDEVYFSHYTSIKYNEKHEAEIFPGSFGSEPVHKTVPMLETIEKEIASSRNINSDKIYNFNFIELTTLTIQILLYMSVSEPDIKESSITKNTYKPRKENEPVKNKFSEIQIYEVGYVYGSTFRKKMKELKLNEITFMSEKEEKHHASPVPHLRRAHYHSYWSGTNRSKKIIKWIEPIFVGFGGKNAEIATIHKMKN